MEALTALTPEDIRETLQEVPQRNYTLVYTSAA
jgi:hypothetical protein